MMEDLCEMLGKLLAVLVIKKIISTNDKDFICGNITEAEWIDGEEEMR